MNRIPVIVTCLVLALAACGAPKRAVKTEQELLARRAQTQMFSCLLYTSPSPRDS